MNIKDVTIDHGQYISRDRLDVVFEKQDELRVAYKVPLLDLDVPSHQSLAREFAWNVTEEIGEVLEVEYGSKDADHIIDEVADAFSFYIELMIMCGIAPSDLEHPTLTSGDKLENWFRDSVGNTMNLREAHSMFMERLSLSINRLKNRKWRQTNVHTNRFLFKKDLVESFGFFIAVCSKVGIDSHMLFDGYLRKHEVNKFRIRSKY